MIKNNSRSQVNMPENQDMNQQIQQPITMYMNQEDRSIKNRGYIDTYKSPWNTRILSINTCGFAPSNNEKIEMIKQKSQELGIDILMLNETNTKWNQINQDKIINKLRCLGREIKVNTADSGRWELTKNEWLPGGVLTSVRGSITSVVSEKVHKGKYGNWIAIQLESQAKTVVIINVYRIPISSPENAICSSLIQYNLIDGEAKTSTQYRNQIFKEIEDFVKNNNNITDVIVAGNFNQSVKSRAIQRFLENIGVIEVHHRYNNIEINQLDHTERRGSEPIDVFAVSRGLIRFVEGSLLNEYFDIIITNHRSYIVDINFEGYFDQQMSE